MNYKSFSNDEGLFQKLRAKSWTVFNQQRQQQHFCDVVINSGDRKFFAHRCILASLSPYFNTLFQSDLSPATEDNFYVVDLSDFPAPCVKLFLDLGYQDPDVNSEDVNNLDFLRLLDFLHIQCFYDAIIEIARSSINLSNCWKYLEVADACRIEKLLNLILIYIATNTDRMDSLKAVPIRLLMICIKSDVFQSLPDENVVTFLISWVKDNGMANKILQTSIVDDFISNFGLSDCIIDKLSSILPDLKNLMDTQKIKEMNFRKNVNSLLLYYDFTWRQMIINPAENKSLGQLDFLKELLSNNFDGMRIGDFRLRYWKTSLFIIFTTCYFDGNDVNVYSKLILARYNQLLRVFETQDEFVLKNVSDIDCSDDLAIINDDDNVDLASISAFHFYKENFYILVEMSKFKWNYSCCYMFQFDLDGYRKDIEPVLLPHSGYRGCMRCVSYHNSVLVSVLDRNSTSNLFMFNVPEQQFIELYKPATNVPICKPVFFKDKVYNWCKTQKQALIELFEFDPERCFWKSLFKLDLSAHDTSGTYKDEDRFETISFEHDGKLWLGLPGVQFLEIDIGTQSVGLPEFSVYGLDVLNEGIWISIPPFLLL